MKLHVQLQCKNLHQYLKELGPEVLDRLYNHPATCLAVYRYGSTPSRPPRPLTAFADAVLFVCGPFCTESCPPSPRTL